MKIAHVVFESPFLHVSGAAHRNRAIGLSLANLGDVSTTIIEDHLTEERRIPKRKRSHVEARLPAELTTSIAHQISLQMPDLVVVDGIFLSDIATRIASMGHRVIVDMHNVESALLEEIDRDRRGWRARLFYRGRWRRARAAEAALARTVSGIWACSTRDAELLRDISGQATRISVVPNPVPDWALNSVPPKACSEARYIFVGHLNYRPNLNAAIRLIERIHPLIQAAIPDAHLVVCGRTPGDRLRGLAEAAQGVTIEGDPPDLSEHYARASAALIPLSEGGGTRLKVLEALALCVPVIATAKATEGLGLKPGQTHLAAETDEDFVQAARRLKEDPALREKLVEQGRAFVEAHHSYPAISRAVEVAVKGW